jgi:ABC-type Fe3+ transport system substrate-binding protein
MSGALCKRWSALGCLVVLVISVAAVRQARAQTGDDLYKKAVQEGIVNFYGTLAQINAEKILPVFEKRYPGGRQSDQLVTRATTEARAGKTLGDIFQAPLKTVMQMRDQKLLLEVSFSEAKDYPADLKGADWVASNLQFTVVAWNTTLVKTQEEPKQFDDLAETSWKNKLIAEPRRHRAVRIVRGEKWRYGSDHRAVGLIGPWQTPA